MFFLEASAFLPFCGSPYFSLFSTGERKKTLSGFKGGKSFHPKFFALPRHRLTYQGQQLWGSLPDDMASTGKVDVPRSHFKCQSNKIKKVDPTTKRGSMNNLYSISILRIKSYPLKWAWKYEYEESIKATPAIFHQ